LALDDADLCSIGHDPQLRFTPAAQEVMTSSLFVGLSITRNHHT
jgi:hypothetical protein